MERKEALQTINDLIQLAYSALHDDCPNIGINEDDITALIFASLDMELKPQNETLLNKYIIYMKELCLSHNTCIECPMNHNCSEQPAKWKEVQNETN